MLSTTEAVVLSLRPHSDKAHVLHAYTRTYGRVSYMVYGLGRKHAIGYYTPFTVLQITADAPSTGSAKPPVVKECTKVQEAKDRGQVQGNIYKQSVAMFLSEVLYHVLRHPMPDEPLFDYIAGACGALTSIPDEDKESIANFHIRFLIDFAGLLGFAIDQEKQPQLVRLPSSRAERQKQLQALCGYFDEHVETWVEPRSLEVLMEIFD